MSTLSRLAFQFRLHKNNTFLLQPQWAERFQLEKDLPRCDFNPFKLKENQIRTPAISLGLKGFRAWWPRSCYSVFPDLIFALYFSSPSQCSLVPATIPDALFR
jgi:hypothetical protein